LAVSSVTEEYCCGMSCEMTCYDLYNPQSLSSILALHGTFTQPMTFRLPKYLHLLLSAFM